MMKAGYLSAVAGAALLVGATSGAQAAPYAYGALSFSNFTLSGVVGAPGVSIVGETVTNTNFATYPGQNPGAGADSGTLTGGVDALQGFSGTSAAPGQNVFTRALEGGSATRADSQIVGAINQGATANLVAEGRLTVVPGVAGSSAGTSTGFSLTVEVTSTTTVSLDFSASADLFASTTGPIEGASAQTNASFSVNGNGLSFNYAPGALNRSVSSTNGTGDGAFSIGPATFDSGDVVLTPGTYQIVLTAGVQERLNTATPTPPPVPEPASMALLGMGLLGLGLIRNRRKAV